MPDERDQADDVPEKQSESGNGSEVRADQAGPDDVKPDTVPDGGLQAWMQVIGAWMLFLSVRTCPE